MNRPQTLITLIAIHPYHVPTQTSHLSFPARATITTKPGQEGNALWFGKYQNQTGWFDPTYCRLQISSQPRSRRSQSCDFDALRDEASPVRATTIRSRSLDSELAFRASSLHSDPETSAAPLRRPRRTKSCENVPPASHQEELRENAPQVILSESTLRKRAKRQRWFGKPQQQQASSPESTTSSPTSTVFKLFTRRHSSLSRKLLKANSDPILAPPPLESIYVVKPAKPVMLVPLEESPEDPIDVIAAAYRERLERLELEQSS